MPPGAADGSWAFRLTFSTIDSRLLSCSSSGWKALSCECFTSARSQKLYRPNKPPATPAQHEVTMAVILAVTLHTPFCAVYTLTMVVSRPARELRSAGLVLIVSHHGWAKGEGRGRVYRNIRLISQT